MPSRGIRSCEFVVIKMGRRQGAYLNRYVTDEQRSRRPIFIATPLGRGQLAVFSRCSRPVLKRYGRFARTLKKPPRRNLRRNTSYFVDGDTRISKKQAAQCEV